MGGSGVQIGELAKRAGVSIDTVRLYERRGLLARAARSDGGFRLFAPEVLGQIHFIKEAQGIGLSLDEIRELLTVGGGADECRRVSELLQAKLSELDIRIKAMRGFRRTLNSHLHSCERELKQRGKDAQCPVVKIKRA